MQISALVPEIFKFEKCEKYANEMTDDVIHATQYYIICVNRAILANLQANSSIQNTPKAIKHFVAMATHSFPVPTYLISICKCFSQANIFISLLDHVYQAPFANMKIEHWGGLEPSMLPWE